MTRYTGALWMPNSNCFSGRNGLTPRYIILHGTAGGISAQNIATYFQGTTLTANPVSANYVDGQDGTIVCCNDENDGAWANGFLSAGYDPWWSTSVNPNNITISIEIVKADLNNADALTSKQYTALVNLVNDICKRWNIPKRWADASGGITGHFSVDPVNRQNCPGNFDWDAFFAALNPAPPKPTIAQPAWTAHASLSNGGTKAMVISATQAAQFQKTWNLSTHAQGYGSGIGLSWQTMNASGFRIGPPTSDEYDDTDQSTPPHAIRVRQFGDFRCEWRGGQAYWFGGYGALIVK